MRRVAQIWLLGLLVSLPIAQADISRERGPGVTLPPAPQPEPPKAPAHSVPRGQLLYENHCRGCHESVVHVRERRRASTLPALEGWVRRWAEAQSLGWGDDEIADVTVFLNDRYYRLGQ